ncbi:MAG: helix-hairpin-helix domain-containing protein [bacterium]|nr:helix-hairpin-helix domain-containing protein [bacterium]
MKRISSQWGLTPGEKRAILFICAAFLVGWGYLQFQRTNLLASLPLTTQDSLAIDAIRNASLEDARTMPLAETKADTKSHAEQILININTADQSELESLPGIGPTLAKRIMEFRTERGKFRKVEDLLGVSGIGPKKFEQIKPRVCCSSAESPKKNE